MVFGSTIWLSTILGQYGDFWKPRHFSALPQQTRENASPTHAISTIGGDKLSVSGFAFWFSWFLQKRAKTRTQRTQLVLDRFYKLPYKIPLYLSCGRLFSSHFRPRILLNQELRTIPPDPLPRTPSYNVPRKSPSEGDLCNIVTWGTGGKKLLTGEVEPIFVR